MRYLSSSTLASSISSQELLSLMDPREKLQKQKKSAKLSIVGENHPPDDL